MMKPGQLVFFRRRYPNIRRPVIRALSRGWPRVMVVNGAGADERRERLLLGIPTRRGYDRERVLGRRRARTAQRRWRSLVRGTTHALEADEMYVLKPREPHGSGLGCLLLLRAASSARRPLSAELARTHWEGGDSGGGGGAFVGRGRSIPMYRKPPGDVGDPGWFRGPSLCCQSRNAGDSGGSGACPAASGVGCGVWSLGG